MRAIQSCFRATKLLTKDAPKSLDLGPQPSPDPKNGAAWQTDRGRKSWRNQLDSVAILPTSMFQGSNLSKFAFLGYPMGHFLTMWSGESKWQLLNGNRQMARENAKTDGKIRSETDTSKSVKTSEKETGGKGENDRGAFFVDHCFDISQWPYSRGHLGFSCRSANLFFGALKPSFLKKKITFGWNFPSFLVLFFPVLGVRAGPLKAIVICCCHRRPCLRNFFLFIHTWHQAARGSSHRPADTSLIN